MTVPLKYAHVERERRFLLAQLPEGSDSVLRITDRYLTGTRMRLRRVVAADGSITRKLGHKVRLGDGPEEVACTNFYLDVAEWARLRALPATMLRKTRHLLRRESVLVAVDEFPDGTLLAEIDGGSTPVSEVPTWLDVVTEVTEDEAWTGARLARPPRREDVTEIELVGGVEKREVVLVPHDPTWADRYAAHESRIRAAVGGAALRIEHIGSTSVAQLAAKPIIDILLTVPDITAEEDYLDPLVAAGYPLRVREPGHRMVRTERRDVHLHVLEDDDPAADDYLLLRDHLRTDPTDRALYEATKQDLAARDWPDMNAYADAKTEVIETIKQRAAAGPR